MTIGIGYLSTNGIVLGSDMELTGVAKYKGNKQYVKNFDNNRGSISAIYSGFEDDFRCVCEELSKRMEEGEQEKPLTVQGIRLLLGQSLKEVISDKKSQFQMLVGIAHERYNLNFFGEPEPLFLRIFRTRVSPAKGWEIIGAGDCELTRYMTQMLDGITLHQALLWTIHVIQVSNSFVQSVGQGISLLVVSGNGRVQYLNGEIYTRKMAMLANEIESMWATICDLDMQPSVLEEHLKEFSKDILEIRKNIPRVLR